MTGIPSSWPDLMQRLGAAVGSGRDAEEWLREAVERRWGVGSLYDLDRVQRLVAFQKAAGVVLALEEAGMPEELVAPDGDLPRMLLYRDGSLEPAAGYEGRRRATVRVFARYFDGVAVEGPPWRVSALEDDRPTAEEYAASADFGAVA